MYEANKKIRILMQVVQPQSAKRFKCSYVLMRPFRR